MDIEWHDKTLGLFFILSNILFVICLCVENNHNLKDRL